MRIKQYSDTILAYYCTLFFTFYSFVQIFYVYLHRRSRLNVTSVLLKNGFMASISNARVMTVNTAVSYHFKLLNSSNAYGLR